MMRTRTKIFIISAILVSLFLLASYAVFIYLPPQENILIFVSWNIFFFSILLLTYYYSVIRKIEILGFHLNEMEKNNDYTLRFSAEGEDDISLLTGNINKLLDLTDTSIDRLEIKVSSRTAKIKDEMDDIKKKLDRAIVNERELTQTNKDLFRMLRHDELTKLPNRILFSELLNDKLAEIGEEKRLFAILIICINNFKELNDNAGPEYGNALLTEFASTVKAALRKSDVLARTGGAEFTILLDDIVHDEFPELIVKKIMEVCYKPIKVNGKMMLVRVAAGFSIYPEDGDAMESLLKNADIALFKAKSADANDLAFARYNENMIIEADKIGKLEKTLRQAVKNNEFKLYFQPMLSLQDLSIVSAEALLRWESPVLGLVNPDRFIPIAEQTGFILELGEWVLREVCRIRNVWNDKGIQPIPIAINLSFSQFHYQDIPGLISKELKGYQLQATSMDVEINSKTIMNNIPYAKEILFAINKTGVGITVDDFGSGDIAINHLKDMPLKTIKIDYQIVKSLTQDERSAKAAAAIIALAHGIGLKAVASGVETEEQLQVLAKLNCDIVQGYFFSKPLPEDQFIWNCLQNLTGTKTVP